MLREQSNFWFKLRNFSADFSIVLFHQFDLLVMLYRFIGMIWADHV